MKILTQTHTAISLIFTIFRVRLLTSRFLYFNIIRLQVCKMINQQHLKLFTLGSDLENENKRAHKYLIILPLYLEI